MFAPAILLLGQNADLEDTTSFNKNNFDHKNMMKFSGIYEPFGGFLGMLVGYERTLNKNYSAEIVYGGSIYGGDNSFGIHSLHGGVKYYFSTTDFQKSNGSLYGSLFVRYQKIFFNPDQPNGNELSHYTTNGYGMGVGLGATVFLTKKILLENAYFIYYSYRDIGQTFSKRSSSAILNSGFRFNPRICLGVNF